MRALDLGSMRKSPRSSYGDEANRDARLVLLQHIDDLLFAKPPLAHSSVSSRRILAAKRGRSRGQGHIPWVLFASSSAREGAFATGGRVPLDGKNAKPGPS